MTTVNVLAMLKNNLPAFRAELLAERAKLMARITQIDAQVKTATDLANAAGIALVQTEMAVGGDEDETEMPKPPRLKGKVKWFNDAKGYGYIATEAGEDVFAHFSDIQMGGFHTLVEGESVSFEMNPQAGPPGLRAKNITRGDA